MTKLHEEVWRGTMAEAATEFGGREVRGEIVLVVGGARPRTRPTTTPSKWLCAPSGPTIPRPGRAKWPTEWRRRSVWAAAGPTGQHYDCAAAATGSGSD